MDNNSDFDPNWASNPGDTISEILNRKKISLRDFAGSLELSIPEIKRLIQGFHEFDRSIAEKLSRVLGGSSDFWIELQALYNRYSKKVQEIEEDRWLKELPIKQMQKNNWIENDDFILQSCLAFFNVPDVWTWRKKYSDITALALFRKSHKINSIPASVATWIRQGERQAEKMVLQKWNPSLFKSKLIEIKKLTRQKDPIFFLEILRSISSECGVAVAIVPTPAGCTASGAAKFLDSGHGLIIVSFRYGTDDHFWFTFFHEAGHLLMHGDRDTFIDENVGEPSEENEEKQANDFATDVLLPGNLKNEIKQLYVSDKSIRAIANKAGVSLGIVVGQLQFLEKIKPNYYNSYKRKFDRDKIFQKYQLT